MNGLVFLSYSFKDIHRVRRLRHMLQLHGLYLWPDTTLTPGTPAWKRAVPQRLAEAACILVVISKNTLHSNWVHEVVSYATQHHIPMLPVVVDGEPGHIMLVKLEGEAWYDLRWSRKYVSEIREMAAHIQTYINQSIIDV
jgi:hypothetical protein